MAQKHAINRSYCKQLALRAAEKQGRGGRFTRVSESFLDRVEKRVMQAIDNEVQTHPSVGKTLK